MGDLSKDFSRWEFTCKCGDCNFRTVDAGLLNILQNDIRDHYGQEVKISSGCRCPQHNLAIGGSDDSYHMRAMAADFIVHGVSSLAVYTYLDRKYPDRLGLGLYEGFCHVDPRPFRARWRG